MGNICRSPLAEAETRKHGINTCSFGISCTHGAKANSRTNFFGKKYQLDLDAHIATPINMAKLGENDLVIVMEPIHLKFLGDVIKQKPQISLLGLWHNPPVAYLHDPFNTNDEYFERCVENVLKSTRQLLQTRDPGLKEWNNSTA